MLIASWNVNSIRSRSNHVRKWLELKNPDVLCLQESKVLDQDFPKKLFQELGYEVITYGQKAYNGVAILSKSNISDIRFGFAGELKESKQLEELDEQKRIISAVVDGVRIINVYVPNGSSMNSEKFKYKINWLKKLNEYLNKQSKREEHTCLLGDFNIALSDRDIYDPTKFTNSLMASEIERENLEKILKDRFIDSFRVFEKSSGHWSWWDYRNNAFEFNKGWRIDHIYVSNNLLPRLKNSVIERDERGNDKPSDHVPIMIDLELEGSFYPLEDEEDDIFGL